MAQTNTDRINDLMKDVAILGAKYDERWAQALKENQQAHRELEAVRVELKELLKRLSALEAKNASLEERCQALQKLSDRGWQGWLALIGAGLAIIVALIKK